MLSPNYLLHVSEGAEMIASQLHAVVLKRIISRIQARQKRGLKYILTATDKWMIQNLQDAGYLLEDIQRDLALYTDLMQSEIREAMQDAGVEALEYDEQVYKDAGLLHAPLKMSPHMIWLAERNYQKTIGTWQNFTGTIADATQQTFISAMDEMYNKVTSGNVGYIEAYAEAIDKVATEGLIITYPSGHTDTIETAALRCVRTGVSQSTAEISMARMDEMDVDLVLVSSHEGARPSHQEWQGKIYSRSGKSKKYPDFVSSTGYGTGDGLCGWNCRHSFGPYIPGMENPFKRYNTKEDKELYEKTQKQRAMERTIRKDKRSEQELKFAIENEKDAKAKAQLQNMYDLTASKLRERNKAYKAFCEDNDLRPLPERLKIARRRPADITA